MLTTIITTLILCVMEITVIVIAAPLAKPSLVLGFLPEDIREAAKNHPEPPKYKQLIAYCLLGLFGIVFVCGFIFLGIDGLQRDYTYWQMALRFIIVLMGMKLFDIIVQDQWLVMSTNFFKNIFPETKDCAGWKNRKFNSKNQLMRLIAYPFLCLITAWVFMLFK